MESKQGTEESQDGWIRRKWINQVNKTFYEANVYTKVTQ